MPSSAAAARLSPEKTPTQNMSSYLSSAWGGAEQPCSLLTHLGTTCCPTAGCSVLDWGSLEVKRQKIYLSVKGKQKAYRSVKPFEVLMMYWHFDSLSRKSQFHLRSR